MFSLQLCLGAAIYLADPFGAGVGSADHAGVISPVRDRPADSHYPFFNLTPVE